MEGGGAARMITAPWRIAQGLVALARAAADVPAACEAIIALRAEMAGLRADLAGLPADSRRLADDLEVVHDLLRTMEEELRATQASVAPMHEDLSAVEAGLVPLPDTLAALVPKLDEIAVRLGHTRSDLLDQLDGLRNDLSGLPFVSRTT